MGSHCSKLKNTIVVRPVDVTPHTLPESLDRIQAEQQSAEKFSSKGKQKYRKDISKESFFSADAYDVKEKEVQDVNETKQNDDDSGLKQIIEYKKGPIIGQTHLAEVCECLDLVMGERLAIKTYKIFEEMETLQEEMELLEDEIYILQDLNHDNLIKYYDVEFHEIQEGESRIEIDIIMEYASGGSLWRLIQKFNCLDERVVQNYVQQMLEGLTYLHSQGAFHGNLKGTNVLIDANGAIKLTDIHSTTRIKHFSQKTHEDGPIDFFIDSIYWTAPEVLIQRKIEASSDIWGIGCVVLEMLTGLPPWYSKGRHEAEKQILLGSPPPIPDDVSETCKDFLNKVFRFNPEERPSLQELLGHPFLNNGRDNSSMSESLQTLQTLQTSSAFLINTALQSINSLTKNVPDFPTSDHQATISLNHNSPRFSQGNKMSPRIISKHNSMRGHPSLPSKESSKRHGLPNVEETNTEEEESSPNERKDNLRQSVEFKNGWSGLTLIGVPEEIQKIDSRGQNKLRLRKAKTQKFTQEDEKTNQNKERSQVENSDIQNIFTTNRKFFLPSKISSFKKASRGKELEKSNDKDRLKDLDNNKIEIIPIFSKEPSQKTGLTVSKEEERKRIEQELVDQLMRINSKDLSQDFESPLKISKDQCKREEEDNLENEKPENLRKKFEEELRRQLERVDAIDLLNQSGLKAEMGNRSIERKTDAPVENKEDQRKKFEEEMRRQLERIDTKELDLRQSDVKTENSFVAEKGRSQFSTS